MSDRKSRPKKLKKRGQDSSSSSSSSSSESTSSLSSDDESNARDLKPIKEYLMDRKELARQLFIAVKGDKLRMMLPQVLKKMELNELEEWCANELSGMSKARILSILNGQPMLQSSDSNDTDDSGPSLEIISDTEEWGDGSDVDVAVRDEEPTSKKVLGSKKDKAKSRSRGKRASKEKEKKRNKQLRGKIKSEPDQKAQKSSDAVQVKKENEGAEQQAKEKDGESLLDLLELEMRARAIRALIRKEEDIIPTNPASGSATQSTASTASANPASAGSLRSKTRARDRQLSLKVVQDKLQELDTSFHKSVGKAGHEISEEEDVVLVLQPTTTIELLSSESEDEGGQGKRRNQKLENERIPANSAAANAQVPKIKESEEKGAGEIDKEVSANGKGKIPSADPNPSSISSDILSPEAENGAEQSPRKANKELEAFRMFKKSQLKAVVDSPKTTTSSEQKSPSTPKKGTDDSTETKNVPQEKQQLSNDWKDPKDAVVEEKKGPEGIETPSLTEPNEKAAREEKLEPVEEGEIEEDKSADLEIIIDLDDYPDDMEELDAGEKRAKESVTLSFKPSLNSEEKRLQLGKDEETAGQTAETWATRYYQTEDVQSVIKESKIQSEIRKRLRERQRLARLNNSPSLNTQRQSLSTATTSTAEKTTSEKEGSPTTGSVEEYLALKSVEISPPSADLVSSNEPVELGTEKIKEAVVLAANNDVENAELISGDEKLAPASDEAKVISTDTMK